MDTVKREMKNGTILLQEKVDSEKALIKKYNCDGITIEYFRTLTISKKEKKYVEQRDKQMSRYIHQLLQNSTKNRYFFAVGAGRKSSLFPFISIISFILQHICSTIIEI